LPLSLLCLLAAYNVRYPFQRISEPYFNRHMWGTSNEYLRKKLGKKLVNMLMRFSIKCSNSLGKIPKILFSGICSISHVS